MHAPTVPTLLTSPTVVRLHALPQALYIIAQVCKWLSLATH